MRHQVVYKLTLWIVGKSSTSVIEWVDNGQGKRTGKTTRGDISGHLSGIGSILWDVENWFDLTLEGEVQGLSWKVSDNVGQVTSPEWFDTFVSQSTTGTIHNTSVWFIKTTLFDHFILILDQEFNSLDRGSSGLKFMLYSGFIIKNRQFLSNYQYQSGIGVVRVG